MIYIAIQTPSVNWSWTYASLPKGNHRLRDRHGYTSLYSTPNGSKSAICLSHNGNLDRIRSYTDFAIRDMEEDEQNWCHCLISWGTSNWHHYLVSVSFILYGELSIMSIGRDIPQLLGTLLLSRLAPYWQFLSASSDHNTLTLRYSCFNIDSLLATAFVFLRLYVFSCCFFHLDMDSVTWVIG